MPSSLDILIIGGSGFVSGTLARVALTAGHRVTTISRGLRPLPPGVTPITADRSDRAAYSAAVRGALAHRDSKFDLAVDCIGFVPADAQEDAALLREQARHLVFISSDFALDPARRSFPQGADAAAYATEGYGGNKRLCELELFNSDCGDMAVTVLRPCHIYGPGSLLGCLPEHGRDPQLLTRMQEARPLALVGGGHFLQQPIYAADLAATIISCAGNARADRATYMVAGPEIIESRRYYEIIAELLGVPCIITERGVDEYRAAHPEAAPFLCHRIYDLNELRRDGLAVPATTMRQGLAAQVADLSGLA